MKRRNALIGLLQTLNPIRWALAFRRSLTGASVTLLLMGIVSLNIVWGYPWLGMFAACVSLFVIGWIVNFLSMPAIHVSVSAPRWVAAGTFLPVSIRLSNHGRLPGMDLRVETGLPCDWLAPGGEFPAVKEVQLAKRGIWPIPPIVVESYFPFYLFRTRREFDSNTLIAVTPATLSSDHDELWRMLQTTLKGIAARIAQGDQVHYIGSREYREGISVRRWDFSSWARLGRPILREFSTPAARSVCIWVDNACVDFQPPRRPFYRGLLPPWRRLDEVHKPLERVLSLAASSIETLVRGGSAVTLSITHDPSHRSLRCEAGGDPSELFIALASIARVDPMTASKQQVARWSQELHNSGNEAVIVYSCRPRDEVVVTLPPGLRWVTDREVVTVEQDAIAARTIIDQGSKVESV